MKILSLSFSNGRFHEFHLFSAKTENQRAIPELKDFFPEMFEIRSCFFLPNKKVISA